MQWTRSWRTDPVDEVDVGLHIAEFRISGALRPREWFRVFIKVLVAVVGELGYRRSELGVDIFVEL